MTGKQRLEEVFGLQVIEMPHTLKGSDYVKNHPKIFMGYSDTTVNHFMYYKAGVRSYYGPSVLMEFAENVDMHVYTSTAIWNTLFRTSKIGEIKSADRWTSKYLAWDISENNKTPRKMTKEEHGHELLEGAGKVEGQLLGGCIEVLDWLRGTEIWPCKDQWKDKILFLETSEEQPGARAVLDCDQKSLTISESGVV